MSLFSFYGEVLRNGSSCSLKKISGAINSTAIKGTVGLLLVWSFVGDCGGKPFHSVGQAEVEEDTTQGSMKEKFPLSLSLHSPVAPFAGDVNGIDGEDDADNSDLLGNVDLVAIGNDRDSWPSSSSSLVGPGNLNKDEHLRQQHLLRHLSGISVPSNYGIVQKRSLGIRPLSFSTASRDLLVPGVGRYDEDSDVDEREDFGRERRSQFSSSSSSALPIYGQSSRGGGGGSLVSSDINSSGETNQGLRIRQKLLNLRNQYGDKWLSFVGPYAYRKRQILYRQCFFNPISCF